MKIGYARVSTQDQRLELQLDALQLAGCEQVFKEKVSAVGKERPQRQRMTDLLRTGDVVLVWKLDGTAAADRRIRGRRPPGAWGVP